ncbi:MAG: aspartyl/asparaginyl beta-hydroxylase domain-containing protein [Luteimonas sp.]
MPVPFVQLPLLFDAGALAAEVDALGEGAWREHPQKFAGNSMLPLLAVGGDPANESFSGELAPTPELGCCPYLQQVLSSFGAVLGRTRLMRLSGQAEVSPHVDVDYYWAERVRVHVPIRTQPGVRFVCGGQTVHMAEGECWIFDTWRQHMVYNDTPAQRIHLVADTVGGAGFWSLVDRGRAPDAQPPAWQPIRVAPDAAARPVLRCERQNVPRVMSPWELQHHLQGFEAELSDPASPDAARVRAAGMRLVRAWRGLWAHHGDAGGGGDDYRAALQAFLDELPDSVSALRLRNGTPWFNAVASAALRPAVRADVR